MVGTTRARVNFFMNRFRKLDFIEYNGKLLIHRSLLTVILHNLANLRLEFVKQDLGARVPPWDYPRRRLWVDVGIPRCCLHRLLATVAPFT